jgi:hypothetical protein
MTALRQLWARLRGIVRRTNVIEMRSDADKAIENSARDLERARARWPLIDKLSRELREVGQADPYGELFSEALGVRRRER